MANQLFTLELDDETVRCLSAAGAPVDVLTRIAHAAADGFRDRHPQRDQTDASLRNERAGGDALDEREREVVDQEVDHLVQTGRHRVALVLEAARKDAERQQAPGAFNDDDVPEVQRITAALQVRESSEDAELVRTRGQRRSRTDSMAMDRGVTDKDLSGERANSDTLIVDLRETNERLLISTIRIAEMADELRESEERYRAVFDLCPAALYACDPAGVMQKFNRHAAVLFGRPLKVGETSEQFGRSTKILRPDGSVLPHDETPMAVVIKGVLPTVRDEELIIERPDRTRVTVLATAQAILNEQGDVTRVLNCFYDISDRKRAEDRVAATLTKERELSEFREMFIGILGHDLRTPLASINMSTVVLLERRMLDAVDTNVVQRIVRSEKRMAAMIRQLLDLTRARLGGGLPLEPEPTDLGAVIRDVVGEFAGNIRIDVDGDLTGIWDTGRLSEVVANLAGNALQYATPGTPVVVSARGEGADVVVEVRNQGAPIPADVLPFIFEPFRRARPLEKSPAGNLGLGLYIANQIVLSHRGTLDGRSADGVTTFVMRIPRTTAPTA